MSSGTTPPITGNITSFAELLASLAEQQVPHAFNAEARTIEIPAKNAPLDSVCYVRWEKEQPYVQIICPLALATPADRHRDLEAAICRANNALPFPGFGLDHDRGTLYFRYTVAIWPEGIVADHFQRLVLTVMGYARDFTIPFRGVLEGKPGDQILQAAVAYAQAKHAASAGSAFKD